VRALGWGGLPWKIPGRRDFFCNLHFSNRASPVVIPVRHLRGLGFEPQAPPLGPTA